MKPIPAVLAEAFSKTFAAASLEDHLARYDLTWLRFYLDFCVKYPHPPRAVWGCDRSGGSAAIQEGRESQNDLEQLQSALAAHAATLHVAVSAQLQPSFHVDRAAL